MFGNNRKANYWDKSRSFLIKQLGLEENATDAEISEAMAQAENDADNTPPVAEVKPETPKADEKKVEPVASENAKNTEGGVSLDAFNQLKAQVETQGKELEALKKVPALNLTSGKMDTPPVAPTKKRAYETNPTNQKHYQKVAAGAKESTPSDEDDLED